MDRFLFFVITTFHVIIFFVLFNIIPRVKEKDYKKNALGRFSFNLRFGKFQKFSLIYFSGLFFITWAINETITKSISWGYITFFYELLLLVIQTFVFLFPLTLIYSGIKKGQNFFEDKKITNKTLTIAFVLLLIIVFSLSSMSYLNKIKRDQTTKEFELQGINVIISDHYFSGKTDPIKFENLTEVKEVVKTYGISVHVSNGAPDYHFLTIFGPIHVWFYPPEGKISMIEIW